MIPSGLVFVISVVFAMAAFFLVFSEFGRWSTIFGWFTSITAVSLLIWVIVAASCKKTISSEIWM